jgi:predicted dinucleotide-binding enzyme
MKIAILGGTGKLGLAFVQHLIARTAHEAAIGSRDAERAIEAARSMDRVQGFTNADAAFHTISHRILRQPEMVHDILVAGGTPKRQPEVMDLIRTMGLHPVDAGPVEVAGHLERMTALLLSINKANKVKESGIKITGI